MKTSVLSDVPLKQDHSNSEFVQNESLPDMCIVCTSRWPLGWSKSVLPRKGPNWYCCVHKSVHVSQGFNTVLSSGFISRFGGRTKSFYAQTFCSFSDIPPACCVSSVETSPTLEASAGVTECGRFAARGPWTHGCGGSSSPRCKKKKKKGGDCHFLKR